MNYQKIILSISGILALLGGYLFLTQPKQPTDTTQFTVGIAAGYAPFISINAQGEYEGFDIDIARALARSMNKTLILKDLGSMTSLFTALNQGSVDALIWGLSITQDRLKNVAMVHYQGERTTSYPLIFWQTIPAQATTMADMNNKTVCVEPGSAQDAVMNSYPLVNRFATEKVDDALLALQYGKADAAFVEPAIAKKFKNKYPEIKSLDVFLSPQDCVHGIGIILQKNNTALINEVQQSVNQLKKDGVIQLLEKKWGIE